jgi:hypothetical protein
MNNDIVKQAPQPQSVAAPPQPVATNAPVKQDQSLAQQVQTAPQQPQQTQQSQESLQEASVPESSQPQAPKKKRPIAAFIAAGVVCLSLIGASIFLGLQDKKETTAEIQKTNAVQASKDSVAKDIEGAITETATLGGEEESQVSDLSDQALGL